MRGRRPRALWMVVIAVAAAGCQGGLTGRRGSTRAEPPLVGATDGTSSGIIEAAPGARPVTMVDRHPLLYKPREYYETGGKNRIVKAAAATFVGVPAGIYGEIRQVVRGQPAGLNY